MPAMAFHASLGPSHTGIHRVVPNMTDVGCVIPLESPTCNRSDIHFFNLTLSLAMLLPTQMTQSSYIS